VLCLLWIAIEILVASSNKFALLDFVVHHKFLQGILIFGKQHVRIQLNLQGRKKKYVYIQKKEPVGKQARWFSVLGI